MGKEAALLVASGTMGNFVSVLTHCRRGDEVILGDQSHIYHYEAGGVSALGGSVLHPVPTGRLGELALPDLEAAIRPAASDIHYAPAGLICLENTHNRCGGTVLSPAYLESVRALADRVQLPIHLDGSRIFNAAVARGCPVRELVQEVDSVQFCLSKGLAAPIGSLVCGSTEFIAQARRYRKMVGGGMRQAGIIAAAGIVALTEMVERLAEDHHNARILAEGLAELPGLQIDLETVQTNLVIFTTQTAQPQTPSFMERLAHEGVQISDLGRGRFRAVTHYGLAEEQIQDAVLIMRKVWQLWQ
jgi:threonine aldolase